MQAVSKIIDQFIYNYDSDHKHLLIKYYEDLAKGKFLRAKLLLLIAGESKQTFLLAAIIEMIHLSSLLHDDVSDHAHTRRGQISINAKYSNETAIMLGDFLYSKAFYELCDFDAAIAKSISLSVNKLSFGQILDINLSHDFNTNIKIYLEMIYHKTAALIEATSFAAAVLAGKDKTLYQKFGKQLGLAYQIIDDILDFSSDEATLGKPAFADLKEGKVTLPLLYLYQELDNKEQHYLKSLFKKNLTNDEKQFISQALHSHKIIEKAKTYAKNIIDLDVIQDEQLKALTLKILERIY